MASLGYSALPSIWPVPLFENVLEKKDPLDAVEDDEARWRVGCIMEHCIHPAMHGLANTKAVCQEGDGSPTIQLSEATRCDGFGVECRKKLLRGTIGRPSHFRSP